MYLSGTWRGYWEQDHYGRQPMHDLVLDFHDGRVEGSGVDIVGRFSFVGTYDERGNVVLTKQYLRAHRVLYRGTYDGEGTIHGTWSIPPWDSGPFALTMTGHAEADAPIISITADGPGRGGTSDDQMTR
jgi:hypothetical protein